MGGEGGDGGDGGDGGAATCDGPTDSVDHCGACDRSCPEPARDDERAVCLEGECSKRCIEGRSRCAADGLVRVECIDGAFEVTEICDFLCVGGTCDGACRPGERGCSGRSPATCSEDGTWEAEEPCPLACHEGECTGECKPEETRCREQGREMCSDQGEWESAACDTGTQCADGECLKIDGEPCTSPAECASVACTSFFQDLDGDGYGATSARFCGIAPPSGYRTAGGDCCDSDPDAYPGQTSFFTVPRAGCGGFDYDCSGSEEPQYAAVTPGCGPTTDSATICTGWQSAVANCGQAGQFATTCNCPGQTMTGCPSICPVFQERQQGCR